MNALFLSLSLLLSLTAYTTSLAEENLEDAIIENPDTEEIEQQCLMRASTIEESVLALVKEFMNISLYPDKSFRQYIDELILILTPITKYQEFCTTLQKHKQCKNPLLLGIYLQPYQKLMPESIKRFVSAKKGSDLLKIVKSRMEKN